MNRRQFLKSVGLAACAPLALVSVPNKTTVSHPHNCRSVIGFGRRFYAHKDVPLIEWSTLGNYDEWPQLNYLQLPTVDCCQELIVSNYSHQINWRGKFEVWSITHASCDPYMPFRVKLISKNGRLPQISWRIN